MDVDHGPAAIRRARSARRTPAAVTNSPGGPSRPGRADRVAVRASMHKSSRRARVANRARLATLRPVGRNRKYLLAALVVGVGRGARRRGRHAVRRAAPAAGRRAAGAVLGRPRHGRAARASPRRRTRSARRPRARSARASSRACSALGLSPHVQTTGVVSSEDGRVAGTVHNIVAATAGQRPRRAASSWSPTTTPWRWRRARPTTAAASPRCSRRRAPWPPAPRPRNDVVFLFTDGEERGLLGSRAFLRDDPWAYGVGVVLNFDSPGSSSPALMYETSRGNGLLVRTNCSAAGPTRLRLVAHVRGLAAAADRERLPAVRGRRRARDELRRPRRARLRPHRLRLAGPLPPGEPAARGRHRRSP